MQVPTSASLATTRARGVPWIEVVVGCIVAMILQPPRAEAWTTFCAVFSPKRRVKTPGERAEPYRRELERRSPGAEARLLV
jgi:hypothetical protein